MNRVLLLVVGILCFLCSNPINAQQAHKGIEIDVIKGHKKITYQAENITDKDISIFFKVNSSGFRRSADRPMITTIPAKKKLNLITLIPLKNADTTHTYMAIITEKQNNIGIRKSDTLEDSMHKTMEKKKTAPKKN